MSKIYEALNKAKENPEDGPPQAKGKIPMADGPSGRFEEQIRSVWANYETLHSSLAGVLGDLTGKVVAFACSVEGEGTTTVVAEYGASLGTSGNKGTLLIDANLRAPKLHALFGVENEKGLADVLTGNQDLMSCVASLGEGRLSVLPSGMTTVSPTSLFNVPRCKKLFEAAREHFAIVLIDCPPVVPYAETPLIASVADGMVLIIESDRTKREIVGRAKAAAQEAKAEILGVVLNRRRYVIPEFLYRYL